MAANLQFLGEFVPDMWYIKKRADFIFGLIETLRNKDMTCRGSQDVTQGETRNQRD